MTSFLPNYFGLVAIVFAFMMGIIYLMIVLEKTKDRLGIYIISTLIIFLLIFTFFSIVQLAVYEKLNIQMNNSKTLEKLENIDYYYDTETGQQYIRENNSKYLTPIEDVVNNPGDYDGNKIFVEIKEVKKDGIQNMS